MHAPTRAGPTVIPKADASEERSAQPTLLGTPLLDLPPVDPAQPTPAPRTVRRSALPGLFAADLLGLAAAIVCGGLLDEVVRGGGARSDAVSTLLYLPVYLIVMGAYGLYRRGRRRLVRSSFPDVTHLVHSLLVSSIIVLALVGPLHKHVRAFPTSDRLHVAFTGVIALVLVPQFRAVAGFLRRRRLGSSSNILIVGSGIVAASVVSRLAKVHDANVVGYVDDASEPHSIPWEAPTIPMLGDLASVPRLVVDHEVDHVVVAFSAATGATLASSLRSLASGVRISVVPRLFDLLTVRSHVDDLYGLPVVDVAPASLGPFDRFAKRLLDVTASGLGLLAVSPVLIVVALAVKATSKGPVLFSQPRTGRGGRTFEIHKFRTMRVGAHLEREALPNEVDGPLFKLRRDPRITRVGGFLRKTSLDELPQLLNVLLGDMSLVGPRPFVTSESAEIAGWAAKRFDVRPGMTGLWQISGRSDLPFEELCRLDYSYVASWSLWWDVRILWHTPAIVFRKHGAY